MQLCGNRIVGREDSSQWSDRRHGLGKNAGITRRILADGVVAWTRLRPLAKLRKLCAIACAHRTPAVPSPQETPERFPGLTARGVVDWPSQKKRVPGHRSDHGDGSRWIEPAAQQVAHAAGPSRGSDRRLRRVLPLQLLIRVAEQVRSRLSCEVTFARVVGATSVPTFAIKAAAPLSTSWPISGRLPCRP